MIVKMILPALTEATSLYFRPIKYSLFPPLGLAEGILARKEALHERPQATRAQPKRKLLPLIAA